MFRRPGTGPSKASATTLCQKCLKRGHYSYECKAPPQERPYKPRPSRTQQLLNPNLKPRLITSTEVPNELLRKKGVADDILKKKDEERGRTAGRKRSRSRSRSRSSSADSVSTISTNRSRSRSRSPPPQRQKHDAREKRSRRSASTDSRSSVHSRANGDRNTRRRMTSFSPDERGRRRGRSREDRHGAHNDGVRRGGQRGPTSKDAGARAGRRVSPSRSRSRSADPMDTADERPSRAGRHAGSPSRSPSPARPQPQRHDRSPSPFSRRAAHPSPSPRPSRNGRDERNGRDGRNGGHPRAEGRPAGRNRFDNSTAERGGRSGPAPTAPPVQRERSLSPFSKRVALTRAMNAG